MIGAWTIVMFLLGMCPGPLSSSEANHIGRNRSSSSLPAVEVRMSRQLQESFQQDLSLQESV